MGTAMRQQLVEAKPIKVLSVSHSAMKDSSERLRYSHLASGSDIDLTLVVPQKWEQFGHELVADPPSLSLDIRVMPIRLSKVGKAKWYMHYYPGLSELVEDLRPDILHMWEEPWSVVALQAARICKRATPAPALVLETEQNILYRLPPPFEQIRRYTLGSADALIGRQPEALSVCRECGYKGEGIVVEYWADPERFFPQDRADARAEFDMHGFTIGYVGRLSEEKGLFTVLEALRLCANNVRFVALGEGPDQQRLMRRAQELDLGDRVQFLPPAKSERVARFINALDAFILMSITRTTWKEQFGRVIMEAQACGVPTIGSSSGAIPSVVGSAGWVVQESDAPGLSRLLDHLAVSPEEIKAKSTAGIHQARSRFSADRIAAGLTSAYREAMRSRSFKTA